MKNERIISGGGGILQSEISASQDNTLSEKENKYTNEDLKIMQGWSLEKKIQVTQTRIIEWYEKWEGKVYVSFSGGKDSTVLLDLVRRIYPNIPAAYIDTGLEYPELRKFVKTFDNVVWLKPKMNFRKVIEKFGYPVISKKVSGYVATAKRNPESTRAKYLRGEIPSKMFGFGDGKYYYLVDSQFKISDYCCTVMKKQPNKAYAKESGRKPILGTMACESINRRNDWLKNGCNAFSSVEPKSKPMSFWTEQDILEYIVRFIKPKYERAWFEATNLSGSRRKKARKFLRKHQYGKTGIASVYGEIIQDKNNKYHTTGCHRTGCVFCAYSAHLEKEPNRFQRLKQTHPKLWNYCMKPWDEGGLGMREVLDYIGVKSE